MKKTTLVFLSLFFITIISNGQSKYPIEVLPGKTIQLKSGGDTLWVINNSQMQKTIMTAMSLEKADSVFKIFTAEINTFKKVIQKKNEIYRKKKEGYDHYVELWKTCDEKLEEQEKKVIKVKSRNKIWTGVGFVSGVVVTFIIQSLL